MKKVLSATLIVQLLASFAFASIYDGGTYSTKKVSESVDVKPYGPDLAPEPGRFSAAPLGKAMYVIGEDKKCYWGNFSKSQDKVVLIIYYGSPVSSEHCVYQSEFTPNPTGYSLYAKNGGKCVASHADVEGEKYDWVVKVDPAELALNDCFRRGLSYGDVIDKKHHKMVAKYEPISITREIVKSEPPVIKVVPEIKEVKEKRKPSAVDQSAIKTEMTGHEYTLQFSSHLSDDEARAATETLKVKGVEAFEIRAEVDGKPRFRVCAGHFSTTKATREYQARLPAAVDTKKTFVQVLH